MSRLGTSWTAWVFGVLTALAGCSLSRSATGSARDAGPDARALNDAFVDDALAPADASDAPPSNDAGVDAVGPDAAGPWTVAYATGAFARSTEASYLVHAPNASGDFLAWAAPNVARFEDRGDGAGPLLLIEGARTNLVVRSRDLPMAPNAAWPLANSGGVMVATNAQRGPDGAVTAEWLTGASGNSVGQVVPLSGIPHTVSAWGRATSTVSVWTAQFAYRDQPNAPAWYVPSQSTIWSRPHNTVTPRTSGNLFPIDLSIGGGALDLLLDLQQIEPAPFASSTIRTLDAPVTRAEDVLTFTATSVPAAMFRGPGHFDQVSPEFASSDVAAGDAYWLFGMGIDGVRIHNDGSGVAVEVVAGGLVVARSASLTFAAHALLGRVEWFPAAGTISVGGTTGATGTAWTWAPGNVRIGGVPGAHQEAFARLGPLSGG